MCVFKHKYIERVLNVEGDGNYNYQVPFAFLGKGDENYTSVCQQVIKELKAHKNIHDVIRQKRTFRCNS